MMAEYVDQEQLRFWEDWESDAIDEWLTARGYSTDGPTVCGSCCGFYAEERWARLTSEHRAAFNAFAAEKGIEAKADVGGIRIA